MLAVKKKDYFEQEEQTVFLVKDVLRLAVMRLQAAKVRSASLDARLLLEAAMGLTREQLLLAIDDEILPSQKEKFDDLLAKRVLRQPMSQILGKREFWGLNFSVTSDTLDPRPDSEALVEEVLGQVTSRGAAIKILDLGTGTGCLMLSLLTELPAATGLAVDFCPNALSVAMSNAKSLGLKERVEFLQSNWFEKVSGEFDVIISNPPYIPTADIARLEPEVAEFEPLLALDGGKDGFYCYQLLIKNIKKFLKPRGFAAFEIGMGQQKKIEEIASENFMEVVAVKYDLGGIARCVIVKSQS